MRRDAEGRHPISKELGHIFKDRRRAKGLTQVELGERAGLSGQFVSNFERGASIIPIDKAIKMGQSIGLSKPFVIAAYVRAYLTDTCRKVAGRNATKLVRDVMKELSKS